MVPLAPAITPPARRLSLVIGTALLVGWSQLAAPAALRAESSAGVDTTQGNILSVPTQSARPLDNDWTKAKHTPSGQLFSIPYAPPKPGELGTGPDAWQYSGHLEFGAIGGDADERNSRYRTYQDVDNGAYLNNFSLLLKKPAGGYYVEATGGAAGHDDQYYGLVFGRYNDWKVKLFYSDIPHVFTDEYHSLWSGVGTGNLTLLPGLTPGGSGSTATDNANVSAQALGGPDMTLSLKRKRMGVRADLTLSEKWKAYVSYTLENRKGARPFGEVWAAENTGGTAPIEIPEAIDYSTHDFLAGVSFAGELDAFNVRLSESLFRNHIDTLTFQEPYRIAPGAGITTVPAAGAFTQGVFDLTPNNNAYNARVEYSRSLPNFFNGSITAVVSTGKWRQDDNLIPYTSIPNLTVSNVTVLPGGAWDTVGALSRPTANATIDTRLADLTLVLNPTTALNLRFKGRFYETEDTTDPFLLVNPNAVYNDTNGAVPGNQTGGLTFDGVTGVWGRLINDGTGQGILLGANTTAAGNIPIQSVYYGIKQYNLSASADYRLNKVSSLNTSLEQEDISHENRVRDRTWEDKAKVTYVNRGLADSTLRLSYEYDRRRGSDYHVSTFDDAFSSVLIPMPTAPGANVTTWAVRNNSGIRTLDLADRDQQIVNLRVNTMVRTDLDAGVSVQARESKFPDSGYGLTKRDDHSANLDLNYQPSPHRNIYAFYSYQEGTNRQSGIAQVFTGTTIGQVTALGTVTPDNAIDIASAPGGTTYPLNNAWSVDSEDRNHVFGLGLRQDMGKATLNFDYTYSSGVTHITYNYNVGGAISAANAVFAGNGMPDLVTDTDYLNASLRYALTERWAVRFVCRYQTERIRDWHYEGIDTTPVVGNPTALPTAVILDGGPHDYKVTWYGVIFEVDL